jgi:hypothetical protein
MTLSSLLALLDSEAFEQVRSEIARPLQAFERGLAERGRSAPVELDREAVSPLIESAHLRSLLEAYLAGKLTRVELYYVANVLALSDAGFSDESAQDATFFLAEGQVSTQEASQSLAALRRDAGA